MSLKRKLLAGVVALALVGIAVLAFVMSRTEDCGPRDPVAEGVPTMQAVLHRCYGPADLLEIAAVERPVPGDDEVLVRVHAAALNPLDWHYMTGTPYVMRFGSGLGRPASDRLGVDFAGTVAAVGRNVTQFRPGDPVYGSRMGAFAEYVQVKQGRALVPRPAQLTFGQAAGLPVAAVTALQAVRDKAEVKPGQKVLVNGASGGVGTYAVQIAKALGAEVTGVCSTRNVDLVRSLGADHVIDYTQQDFTRDGQRYDAVIDAVGNHSLREVRRALTPAGVHVVIGGPKDDPWLGPVLNFVKAPVASWFTSQRAVVLLAQMNEADLRALNELVEAGKLTTVIDRSYPLAEAAEAMRHLETRRARGKIVLEVVADST